MTEVYSCARRSSGRIESKEAPVLSALRPSRSALEGHPLVTGLASLRAVLDGAPVCIFVTDQAGDIVYRNPAALLTAKRLENVVQVNLGVALAYNLVTVSLAAAGLMTPLLCAVLMPVSSLSTVLATTLRLRKQTWMS